jgi:hypothetical protein
MVSKKLVTGTTPFSNGNNDDLDSFLRRDREPCDVAGRSRRGFVVILSFLDVLFSSIL